MMPAAAVLAISQARLCNRCNRIVIKGAAGASTIQIDGEMLPQRGAAFLFRMQRRFVALVIFGYDQLHVAEGHPAVVRWP